METNSSNILFVDGETSILESIKRLLLAEGKQAHFASTVDEAEKIIASQSIDVMFVDITIGNLVEILEKVQESNPDIVKIVISDFSHLSSIINSIRQLNLHSFMMKPWKKHELLETLESAEEYSIFLKAQANEKENLKQKNVIYQRIINFKDDVGENNKADINALKTALLNLSNQYEKMVNNASTEDSFRQLKLDSLKEATEMFGLAFPTFIEKFTVEELVCAFSFDEADVKCEDKTVAYVKNLTLIKELTSRAYKFISDVYEAQKIYINIYPEEKLFIRFDFKCENSKIDALKMFLDYLKSLLFTITSDLNYEINEKEENNVSVTFSF